MKQNRYPPGWDEARVRLVLEHYEAQSDEEAVAEDEASYEATTHTSMGVPVDLVPAVRELIARRQAGQPAEDQDGQEMPRPGTRGCLSSSRSSPEPRLTARSGTRCSAGSWG